MTYEQHNLIYDVMRNSLVHSRSAMTLSEKRLSHDMGNTAERHTQHRGLQTKTSNESNISRFNPFFHILHLVLLLHTETWRYLHCHTQSNTE